MNRIWSKILVTSILGFIAFGHIEQTLAGSPDDKNLWMILERVSENQPEIVSIIKTLPSNDVQQKFSVLLEITWGYESLPNGLPVDSELIYARNLYAGLDNAIGEHGVNVMTRTGNGGRTMYYYVDEVESTYKNVSSFLDAQLPFSIKVVASHDTTWQQIYDVLNAVKR